MEFFMCLCFVLNCIFIYFALLYLCPRTLTIKLLKPELFVGTCLFCIIVWIFIANVKVINCI